MYLFILSKNTTHKEDTCYKLQFAIYLTYYVHLYSVNIFKKAVQKTCEIVIKYLILENGEKYHCSQYLKKNSSKTFEIAFKLFILENGEKCHCYIILFPFSFTLGWELITQFSSKREWNNINEYRVYNVNILCKIAR